MNPYGHSGKTRSVACLTVNGREIPGNIIPLAAPRTTVAVEATLADG
jgi:hypothetical protein